MASDVAAVTCAEHAVDGLSVELGEENMRDGMEHRFGRAFEQVRDTSVQFSLAQADGVVD